jgi:hypothetical protein
MKIQKGLSYLRLAVFPALLSAVSVAQVDLKSLVNLDSGPGALAFTPIFDLGLLPYSLQNGGAVLSAGEDILLSSEGPLPTVLGLGGTLKGQLVPVLDVLMENPLSVGDYFLNGGTVVSTGLALPRVPLLNAPLPSL